MQDISKCIYMKVNKFNKQLKQYLPHGSTKFKPVLNVFSTGTPQVMTSVDVFLLGYAGF